MCMKNVNITSVVCDRDQSEIGGAVQTGKVLDEILVRKYIGVGEEAFLIDSLTVFSFANAFAEFECVELKKKYNLLWVLESANISKYEQLQLAETVYDTTVNQIDGGANGRAFSNQIFKFTLRDVKIKNSNERYFLKVYIKEEGSDEKWQIQSINSIYVKEEC